MQIESPYATDTTAPTKPPTHSWKRWLVPILCGIFAVLVIPITLMVGGIYTVLLPRQYASTTTVQIHMTGEDGMPFALSAQRLSAMFMLTQMEIIKSREVLDAVIKKLDLQKEWGEPSIDEAYMRISKMIDVREIRGIGDMLSIVVFSTDPEEAARIANAIADEYRALRTEADKDKTSKMLVTMWEKATASMIPARPRVLLNMVVAGGIGLFLCMALVLVAIITAIRISRMRAKK